MQVGQHGANPLATTTGVSALVPRLVRLLGLVGLDGPGLDGHVQAPPLPPLGPGRVVVHAVLVVAHQAADGTVGLFPHCLP